MKLSLKSNFSWNFFGNIIFSFGQWAILAIMTKLIVVEEVGMFSYAVAFTTPFILFFQMQLTAVQVTDTEDIYTFNDYLGFRLFSSLITFIFLIFISIIFKNDITMIFLICSIILMKLSDSISDIFYGLFQKNEYMKYIAISRVLKTFFVIFGFATMLFFSRNLILSILFITLLKFLVIIFYDLLMSKKYIKIKPTFHLILFKKILISSLPLGVMSLLMSLDANIPKYFIKYYDGVENLAYFSALSYINMIGGQMITSISQAATPRLAIYYTHKNKKNFIKLLVKMTLIGLFIGVASVVFIILFGNEFISTLYSEEYAQHMNVFIIIMISGAINYTSSFMGNAITAARAFKIQPYLGGLWVLISLLASFILVPKFGLLGGAMALVVSSLTKLISKFLVVLFLLKNNYNDKV